MTTYGYCRVSTIDQAEHGNSLDIQRERIKAESRARGVEPIAHFFIDRGVSGGKPLVERPQGKALLDCLQSGDVIIALKLDRLFRNATDAVSHLEQFKSKGIRLFLLDMGEVTGNGISAMVFTILSAVAQFERERIAERISETKAVLKANKRYLGGKVPFGYRVQLIETEQGIIKQLIEDTMEQQLIVKMKELRQKGLSYKRIAKYVETEFKTNLSHMGVKRVLCKT